MPATWLGNILGLVAYYLLRDKLFHSKYKNFSNVRESRSERAKSRRKLLPMPKSERILEPEIELSTTKGFEKKEESLSSASLSRSSTRSNRKRDKKARKRQKTEEMPVSNSTEVSVEMPKKIEDPLDIQEKDVTTAKMIVSNAKITKDSNVVTAHLLENADSVEENVKASAGSRSLRTIKNPLILTTPIPNSAFTKAEQPATSSKLETANIDSLEVPPKSMIPKLIPTTFAGQLDTVSDSLIATTQDTATTTTLTKNTSASTSTGTITTRKKKEKKKRKKSGKKKTKDKKKKKEGNSAGLVVPVPLAKSPRKAAAPREQRIIVQPPSEILPSVLPTRKQKTSDRRSEGMQSGLNNKKRSKKISSTSK